MFNLSENFSEEIEYSIEYNGEYIENLSKCYCENIPDVCHFCLKTFENLTILKDYYADNNPDSCYGYILRKNEQMFLHVEYGHSGGVRELSFCKVPEEYSTVEKIEKLMFDNRNSGNPLDDDIERLLRIMHLFEE